MYFDYNVFEKKSDKLLILKGAKLNNIKTSNAFIGEYLEKVCSIDVDATDSVKCTEVNLNLGIPDDIVSELGGKYQSNEEGYVIDAGEVINVYAETERAVIHAICTIRQLIGSGEFTECFIYDRPHIPTRGYRFFLPGRKGIQDFKAFVDNLLVPYKYNYMVLEIGGGLEYKKHPQINIEWEKFAQAMQKDSGIADKLQHFTYPWSKNAIHPEVGGGSYITQEEAREIEDYCADRGIEICPMIPTLSHADYIVRAYPEINERVEDKDPDTYCPLHPKTYEIVFDIIDEVLETFKRTKRVFIGHDEVVTIGICDRCKDKDPVDLFIGDIEKIHNYLKEKGMQTIVACDKFTKLYKDGLSCEEANGEPYIDKKGKLCGGLQGFEKGDPRYVPALHTAIDRLPRDIVVSDWYWRFNFDKTFKDHRVIVHNFRGRNFVNWKKRTTEDINIIGITTSYFGRMDYKNYQKNMAICDIMYNSYIGWSENYDDCDKGRVFANTLAEMNEYYRNYILKVSPDKKYIDITHSTNHAIPYRVFWDGDFVKDEDYYMGDYVIAYTDGTIYKEPVYFGANISNCDIDVTEDTGTLVEVSGMTVPCTIDGKAYYTWTFENPYADKEIKDITFVSSDKFPDAKVYTKEIKY